MFRTELPIAPATGQLPRTARVLTMGSCFADSIGLRLAAHKVETLANPFGTVFQPLALGRLLRAAAGEEVDWQQHVVEARGRWQSYDLHGSIGADSPVDLLQTIQELVRRTGEFLRQADVVLLTLGTAWAYRLRETGELVNNCHKQPADLFVHELLTPDEIINNLAETHASLRRLNPNLRFVLTVSPVRHLKDTLPLNSVSKSVLRVATHILSDLLPGVAYFPAYELLVDDLRDYRFYAADMLHPSEIAEDYIWDKFARTYFDADFGRFRKEWAAVRHSLAHRPLHAAAPEHREFLENTLQKLEQFSLRKVQVDAELQTVRTQLAALPAPKQPAPVEVVEDDEERIDVGENSTPGAAPLAEAKPPRLSPEEFRAQRAGRSERGRRDGRDRGQPRVPTENEQFQTALTLPGEHLETAATENPLALLPTKLSTAEQLLEAAAASVAPELDDAADPAKKKKRRSRGGAKRTARKHALRLAAGETTTGAEDDAETVVPTEDVAVPAEQTDSGQPEITPPVAATQPAHDKRDGRRKKGGQVARVALFAAATDDPIAQNTPVAADAEAPVVEAETSALATPPAKSRNNRNRARKAGLEVSAAFEPQGESVSLPAESAPEIQMNSAASAPAASQARRSNRPKRAVSGARPEKPAVDVPIIPVPDPSQPRTQVAAGRMTGSSATLIEATPETAPKKRVAAPKKAPAPAKAAAPKAKPASKPAAAIAPVPGAPAETPAKASPKRKPAAKPRAAAAKPAAAKPKAPKKPAKPAE